MAGSVLEVVVFGSTIKVWELLAVLGVALCALEVILPGFIVLPIGLAFLMTAVVAMFLKSWVAVLFVLGFSLFFMVWIFQSKIKNSKVSTVLDTNVDSLKGKEVTITEAVKSGQSGEAKLYGDRWTVYSLSDAEYAEGQKVKVVKVDGNKLALD